MNSPLPLSSPRWIWIFVIVTFLLSALFDYPIFGPKPLSDLGGLYLWLVMWCPGIVALGLVALGRTKVRELGLLNTGGIHLAWGLLLPFAITVPIYVLASMTGFCTWAPAGLKGHVLGSLLLLPRALARALGEEIGWRGFLFPQLRQRCSFSVASLITGFIWALWHFAVIVQGGYLDAAQVPLSLALVFFTLGLVGQSFLYGWLRERSASVWPPALFHGVFNWFTQRVVSLVLQPGPKASLVIGEMSIGFAVMGILLVVVLWKGPRREPAASTEGA